MENTDSGRPMQMWLSGEYRDVAENERLVYTESVSDQSGDQTRSGAEVAGSSGLPGTDTAD
jgi:hypothetical protein